MTAKKCRKSTVAAPPPVDSEVEEVIRRGSARKAARSAIDYMIAKVIQQSKVKFPDYLDALAEALDWARERVTSENYDNQHKTVPGTTKK